MKNNISFKKLVSLLGVVALLQSLFFCNVYAETVGGDSPIIGVNITYTDYEYSKIPIQASVRFTDSQTRWQCMSSHSSMGCQVWQSQGTDGVVDDQITGTISYTTSGTVEAFLYEYDFVFDNDYVGFVTFSNGNVGATTTSTYYVNGSHLVLTSTSLITSFNITSYQLNVIPGNLTHWDFPIESFSAVSTAMSTLPIVDYFQYYSYIYPIFSIKQNDILFNVQVGTGQELYLVYFISGRISQAQMNTYLEWSEGYNIKEYSYIRSGQYNGRNGTFYRVVISWDSGGFKTLKYIGTIVNDFIPIYAYGNNGYVSTEFALLWGLDNKLLVDLDIIANGTTQSNNSKSELESATSEMNDSRDELLDMEDSFNDDMNSSLNNIPSFSIDTGFGSKFLNSAQWVRTQFENLTASNPYGSLLSFSLLLGLSLLIIGRIWG